MDTTVPTDIYLGADQADEVNGVGNVLLSHDPTAPPWLKTTDFGVTRVLGVGAGRRPGDSSPTLFAATKLGMYYLPPTGTWTPATGATFDAGDGYVPISYPRSTGSVVYGYDRATGTLYRASSSNFGSWVVAWQPSGEATDAKVGGMAADPQSPNIVWLTTTSAVHRLDCSHAPCTDMMIAALSSPGPITIQPNTSLVYVATRAASGVAANLYTTTNGSSWSPVAGTDVFYQKAAGFPRQLSVAPDAGGTVYVATFGDGVVKVTGTVG